MTKKVARNYQIDCLKFLMAIFVLLGHSRVFLNENTRFFNDELLQLMACWAVHIFFIVSGFLMVKGLVSKESTENAAKEAFIYSLSRYKKICGPLITSFVFALSIYIYI